MDVLHSDIEAGRSITAGVPLAFVRRMSTVIHAKYLFCELFDDSRQRFLAFVDRHEAVLRGMLALDARLIFRHFHFFLEIPSLFHRFEEAVRSQPFPERRQMLHEYLDSQWGKRAVETQLSQEPEPLLVDRLRILEDTCAQLANKDVSRIMSPTFAIKFRGEDGARVVVFVDVVAVVASVVAVVAVVSVASVVVFAVLL